MNTLKYDKNGNWEVKSQYISGIIFLVVFFSSATVAMLIKSSTLYQKLIIALSFGVLSIYALYRLLTIKILTGNNERVTLSYVIGSKEIWSICYSEISHIICSVPLAGSYNNKFLSIYNRKKQKFRCKVVGIYVYELSEIFKTQNIPFYLKPGWGKTILFSEYEQKSTKNTHVI